MTSADIRQRVEAARGVQAARGFDNAQIPTGRPHKLCDLERAGERTLELAGSI